MDNNELKNNDKSKKVGTLVSAYIEQKAYDALLRHCDITGQSKTKAIERAIMSYCKDDDSVNNMDNIENNT